MVELAITGSGRCSFCGLYPANPSRIEHVADGVTYVIEGYPTVVVEGPGVSICDQCLAGYSAFFEIPPDARHGSYAWSCSFCSTTQHKPGTAGAAPDVVAGPGVYICEDCTTRARLLLARATQPPVEL